MAPEAGLFRMNDIYIIGPEAGPFKIGLSGDVTNRLRHLQSSNFAHLKVWHCEPITGGREIERYIHHQLDGSHIRGEWFDVTLDAAKQAIKDGLEGEPTGSRACEVTIALSDKITGRIDVWRAKRGGMPRKIAVRKLVDAALEANDADWEQAFNKWGAPK